MTIARRFCFASVVAAAALIAPGAPSHAAQSCCDWVDGKYINLKSGKHAKPPKAAIAPFDGAAQATPKPATPANPYYRLAEPYYIYSDPYRGLFNYYAVPPYNPGYSYGYTRPFGSR